MNTDHVSPREMANAIRALSMDAVEAAKSGHPGMPMGMADVATVLFSRFLKFVSEDPLWPDRDRFVLSAGHGSMLLYALLHLTGYEGMPLPQIRNFRQLGSVTAGHPEYGLAAGIETTTGPLGQGLANAVGMAIAERVTAARFPSLVDHRTWVIAGDGCLMEGISHEAASLAGHLCLNRLIVLFDDNHISIDGPTSMAQSDDTLARFEAYGWRTDCVDGHDQDAVADALSRAVRSDRPSFIACRTTIGFGSPGKQGTAAAHGAPLGPDEVAAARESLDWHHDPFVIPEPVRRAWLKTGTRCADTYRDWNHTLGSIGDSISSEYKRMLSGDIVTRVRQATESHISELVANPQQIATRKASELALVSLVAVLPELIGGSADLTGSNNTRVKSMTDIARDDFSGNYIRYGVREHAMAAAMNGMAVHGGVIPYGGTFLSFSDYCRPSIRLAALMQIRTVHVMTHDSIGLGEDGPTHQPVEHLASLRAMPNLKVFRPADAVETAECWELALTSSNGPSVIALSRQNLPQMRVEICDHNLSANGAYVLSESDGTPDAIIVASGSEVEIALAAQVELQKGRINVRVVSAPCLELFAEQDAASRDKIIPRDVPVVVVEAAVAFGWTGILGQNPGFVGMSGFGESAPAKDLYRHFGITSDAVVSAVNQELSRMSAPRQV